MKIYKIKNIITGEETYYSTGLLAEQILKKKEDEFPDIEFELNEYEVVEDKVNSRDSLLNWAAEKLKSDTRLQQKFLKELDDISINLSHR